MFPRSLMNMFNFKKDAPITYRPDIDGLRAIAVLAVVFNHLGLSTFRGGYVGVDIFFVISGYLITKILMKNLDQNTFSLWTFYERRMRRIFPALYGVLITTALLVSQVFSLGDIKAFYKTVVATLFFFSNIQFYKDIGYFEVQAQFKPLLHTWSLGVEEQFYILFPLILWALYTKFKTKKSIMIGCAILWVASFIASVITVSANKDMAFYYPHTRAWELLTGALLALGAVPALKKNWYLNLLALIGGGAILGSILLYQSTTSFPGVYALAPVLGAALLIYTGGNGVSFVAKTLSLGPFVFLGAISYSLYLWHWVLISFNTYWGLVNGDPLFSTPILFAIILGLSIISWACIEQPFRNRQLISPKTLVIMFGLFVLGVGVFSKMAYKTQKLDAIIADPETLIYTEDFLFDKKYIDLGCNVGPSRIDQNQLCTFGATDKTTTDFILWGDSYAEPLAPAFEQVAAAQNQKFAYAIEHGCPPILDVPLKGPVRGSRCEVTNTFVFDYIKSHGIKHVVIHMSYGYSGLKLPAGHVCEAHQGQARFLCLLKQTIDRLKEVGATTHIIGPMPSGIKPVELRKYRNQPKDHRLAFSQAYQPDPTLIKGFQDLQSRNEIQYYDPAPVLCDDYGCRCEADKYPLFSDGGHLSRYSPTLFLNFVEKILNEIRKN